MCHGHRGRFALLCRDLPVGIFQTTPEGRLLAANSALAGLLGYADVRQMLREFQRVQDVHVDADTRQRFVDAVEEAGSVTDFAAELRRADGQRFWGALSARAVRDRRGRTRYYEGTICDITAQRHATQLEDDRKNILEMIARCEPLGSILLRLTQSARNQRDQMAAALFLRHEGHWHCGASLGVPEEVLATCRSVTGESLASSDPVAEILEEHPRWASCRAAAKTAGLQSAWLTPVQSGNGELLGMLACFLPEGIESSAEEQVLLVSRACLAAVAIEHHRLSHRLAHQAHHDPLTGLPNRTLCDDRLRLALAQAQRSGQQVALFFIDIDGFKHINDTLGHAQGDELLKNVAQRLSTMVRQGDTFARMGGDEFALITPALADRHQAARIAQRLLDLLKPPFNVCGQEIFVTASIGIGISPQDGPDAETLRQNSDAAMYRAKTQGRNCFECFAPEFSASARERLHLETHLRRAVDQELFEMHYQPQVDPSGELLGFEALLRWRHPQLGMVPPARFIPIAEESGLILPLGTWVLREACRQAAIWNSASSSSERAVTVAVNVSAMQFARPDFVATVFAAINAAGLDPRRLEIEITESLLMRCTQDSAQKLSALRAGGVGIAIDDFGTGYSSLAYLHQLPIDTLKIDRSFVKDLSADDLRQERKTAVIRSVASLAFSLDLRLVAEGVETEIQRKYLADMGCHVMQGYLFAPALTVQKATERLVARTVPLAIPA